MVEARAAVAGVVAVVNVAGVGVVVNVVGADGVLVAALKMFLLSVVATTPSLLMTGVACEEKVLISLGLMLVSAAG